MFPHHIAILKANTGELTALERLDSSTAQKILPLFEVGRLTDAIRLRKYILNSSAPVMTHIDRVLAKVAATWGGRAAMLDGYDWAPDARVENGEHAIAYMVRTLIAHGVPVIPVVGYDRWADQSYRIGIRSVPSREDGHYCLRLDSGAVEDADEPELFTQTIQSMVEELELIPSRCSVLLDFGDISADTMSVDRLVAKTDQLIELLEPFDFSHYVIAGCSLPATINLAVESRDSVGSVLRKEMVAWQAIRLTKPRVRIISGDYGVRGPRTTEAPSQHTNGKIRHTVDKEIFVVRGHAMKEDGSNVQMQALASTLMKSQHFLGANFSWGDAEIRRCSTQGAFGSLTTWIAIDTNHHLTFVVQEVDEFQRSLIVKPAVAAS
jgi:hypothetical protein